MEKSNIKKEFIWNSLGSGTASFISLLLMIIVTRINGTDVAGVFTLTYATAIMFYCLALYSGRTYQVSEQNKDISDNDFIKHRFITSILMIIVTIIFGLIKGYTDVKLIILILLAISKVLEALSDVYHGIMQKNKRLDIVGKSLLIRSILEIFLFVLIDVLTKNIILSCVSLIIVNLIILIFVDIKYGNRYKEKDIFKFDSIKKIFILGFFTFAISFIANYLYNIPRYALDNVASDSIDAIYGIIIMPATIIMVINMFIIQPLVVPLKELFANKKKSEFLKYILKIIGVTIMIGIVALLGAYFVGIPMLEILYGISLDKYLISLLIIITGAMLYTIATVFSNSLIIMRKTSIQFIIYVIVSILAYFISNYLVDKFNFDGAIYAYLIMMAILLLLYIIYFVIIFNREDMWKKE